MKTAVEHYGLAPDNICPTMAKIRNWMDQLPDPPPLFGHYQLWSCHAVCRAAKALHGHGHWRVADGHFGSSEHSWIYIDRMILDVYPVASMGGLLLLDGTYPAWKKLYEEDQVVFELRRGKIEADTAHLIEISKGMTP